MENQITKKRKKLLIAGGIFILLLIIGWFLWWQFGQNKQASGNNIVKVGVLHSLTGTMAISEKSVVDATLLAIDEINENGGVLGKKIEPIVVDGASDWPTFANEAEKLIVDDKVSVVFGGWTSASRKIMKPVFEKHDSLLFYPVQYEGLEQSPNIIYTGATPNQQIIPAVKWTFNNLGKKIFLVGSDYVFPRSANAIIKDQTALLGGEIVGEEYAFLGSQDVKEIVQKIIATQPDVILNTINGDTNVAFFRELQAAGITPDTIPVVSFSIAEEELRTLEAKKMVGNYAAWNYFQSINIKENHDFVKNFKDKYGPTRVTDDPMEAAYFGVYLWASAVKRAGSFDTEAVRKEISKTNFKAPEGLVFIDSNNQHTWKTIRIGRIREDGQFDIVWHSLFPISPEPYPLSRTKADWEIFLNNLYVEWDRNWSAQP